MGAKKITTRTLETGEQVYHHPANDEPFLMMAARYWSPPAPLLIGWPRAGGIRRGRRPARSVFCEEIAASGNRWRPIRLFQLTRRFFDRVLVLLVSELYDSRQSDPGVGYPNYGRELMRRAPNTADPHGYYREIGVRRTPLSDRFGPLSGTFSPPASRHRRR